MSKEEKIVGQCKSSVSKELEALNTLCKYIEVEFNSDEYYICREAKKFIGNSLQRLEAIDNANPSEALECLEWVIKNYIGNDYYVYEEELITIKQTLLKAQEQEKGNARAFGKDIINLDKTLKQTIDKPILYVCRYGNKYIVPQKLFEEQEKVLEIILEKDVDIYILKSCKTVDEYNSSIVHIVGETRELIEEEFDLLKEVLNNDRI